MRKILSLSLCAALLVTACSSASTQTTAPVDGTTTGISEESSADSSADSTSAVTIVEKTETSENTESDETTDEETTPEPDEGWYVKGDTVYITKIRYSVVNVMGSTFVYETPWSGALNDAKYLNVDADMEYMDEYYGMDVVEADRNETRNMTGLFSGCPNLETASITIDMSGVTDASAMLMGCTKLKSATINLSGDVVYASEMLADNEAMTEATVSLTGVENVQRMFYGDESLTAVSLSIDGNIENCAHMFEGCSSLKTVNVPFEVNKDTSFLDMFDNCASLTSVKFQGFSTNQTRMHLFDSVNSITSYEFADDWTVEGDGCNPVGDSFNFTQIVPLHDEGDHYFTFVFYTKGKPSWYTDYVEYIYQLGGDLHLVDERDVDVYFSSADDCGDFEVDNEMILGVVRDALSEYDEKVGEMNDTIDKAALVADIIKGME